MDTTTKDEERRIIFHVTASIHRGRSLAATLRGIYRNHGFRPSVTRIVTDEYQQVAH